MNPLLSCLAAAVSCLAAVCLLAAAPHACAQQFEMFPMAGAAASPPPAAAPPVAAGTPSNADLPPSVEKAGPAAPTETEILATHGATFSSADRVAVFEGDVRVNDPRFQLACVKLTVYIAKGGGDMLAGSAPAPTPGATPAEPSRGGGGIDHAVAEGDVIIIQKRPGAKPGEEPKISRGHAQRVDYDGKTGDMVLRGSPSIEQNGNTHTSLAPSTVMKLDKNNNLTTVGPSRTTFIGKGKADDLPGAPPAAGAAPGGKKARKGGGPARPQ